MHALAEIWQSGKVEKAEDVPACLLHDGDSVHARSIFSTMHIFPLYLSIHAWL